MKKRNALITGITGQDGSYLAELLLGKGYEVHGIVRRVAFEDPEHRLWRIKHILDKITLHAASLESYASLYNVVENVKPDECYHLASQSFVSYSFEDAFMFGKVKETPQNEDTPFYPRSPYGISKVAGFDLTRNFRESYGMFACSGLLFNHESPRRGFEFVTRKITSTVAKIKAGRKHNLRLGNLDAKRDWGSAADYVYAMWLMLQQDEPDDYVIATNETHSVKEFAEQAFRRADLNWEDYVVTDQTFYRPAEVRLLQGDYAKAKRKLGWEPKIKFDELVKKMVDADMQTELIP